MLYSIINTKKGEDAGFKPITHRLLKQGKRMIVNENELRLIGNDIGEVAKSLDGKLLTYAEVTNEIKADQNE